MTTLFYLGAEQAGWRSLLADNGVTNVGMSYWSWRKRMPKKGVDIESYGFDGVLLESGGYQANSRPEEHTQGEWRAYGDEYAQFVLEHLDDLTLVTEFDCLALGAQYIADMRRLVWSQVDPEKFLPVWHPEQGLPALEHLGEQYRRIAISQAAVTGGGLNVTPHLNALARKGVKLHGTAMTKPAVLRQVAFATAASTSWLSPMQYGDTQVWNNNELVRYPMKMKIQARMRHQSLFTEIGLDAQKIIDDDKTEVTRLALWSWRQQEDALKALRYNTDADRSNNALVEQPPTESGTALQAVVTPNHDGRNTEMPREPLQERAEDEIVGLPMFGTTNAESMNTATKQVETIKLLEVRGKSARTCNTCVIASKCPQFKPNTTCAYDIPAEVKTKEQRAALLTGLIEMQAQRVQFGLLVEQVNGGYPDPNLSQEYDRLLKALTTQADLEDNRDFLKISVEARGKTGVLSRLFDPQSASRAVPAVQQLDPDQTDMVANRVIEGQRVT